MVTLYADQSDMIERVVDSLRKGHRSVLMQYPTGGGKSVMATEIVRRALSKGNNVWFSVPRRELIRQMGQTFDDFGVRFGMMAAGHRYRPDRDAYICSTDTLKSRLRSFTPPKLAVIDETHFGGAGLDAIIKYLKEGGTTILGLSATPWRTDSKGLGCWYDDMVCGPSVGDLIKSGRLSQYKAFAPSHVDLKGIKITAGDYNKKQLSELMEGNSYLVGEAVQQYKKFAQGLTAVTFCVSIIHSQQMAEAFNNGGVPSAHMDGNTPEDERKRIAIALAKGELLNVTCADLLCFGYDLKSASGMKDGRVIQAMIDRQPTKSLAKQMQKNGRFLRYDGTTHVLIDGANNIMEHGLPCDEREWSLADREKGIGGKKGEKLLPVKECDKCHYCHKPAPQCPNCGRVYEVQSRTIEEVDGELAEVDAAAMRKKMEARRQVGRAKSIDELEAIARERGYRSGWVQIQAKLRGLAS